MGQAKSKTKSAAAVGKGEHVVGAESSSAQAAPAAVTRRTNLTQRVPPATATSIHFDEQAVEVDEGDANDLLSQLGITLIPPSRKTPQKRTSSGGPALTSSSDDWGDLQQQSPRSKGDTSAFQDNYIFGRHGRSVGDVLVDLLIMTSGELNEVRNESLAMGVSCLLMGIPGLWGFFYADQVRTCSPMREQPPALMRAPRRR
jgi:hypothetical protein